MLENLFYSVAGRRIFSEENRLQCMLDVETALARAQAAVGTVPTTAAQAIAGCCDATLFDRDNIATSAALSGNLAIPMVKMLTAIVHERDADAARYVHLGATSQDILDTGMVLQLRSELMLLDEQLKDLALALADLTRAHRSTAMVGRTWLQHAAPISFGLKTAGWLDALLRHRDRLRELMPRCLVLQFGGSVGTLAALGDSAEDVAKALASQLNLDLPSLPWHAHRDRFAEVAFFHGLVMGTLGKMATDLSLMMQTEVAEVFEPGGGGSSTMPHKRNPVAAAFIRAAALRVPGLVSTMLLAMTQEHERGLGAWQAEWDVLPDLCMLTLGALEKMTASVRGLEVYPAAMQANLERTHGLIMAEAVSMALARTVGKMKAHSIVETAARQALQNGRNLREVISLNPSVQEHLSVQELDEIFRPEHYAGSSQAMIDRVLAACDAQQDPPRMKA